MYKKPAGSHWKGSRHCFLSDDRPSWAGLNDREKMTQFATCARCEGRMVEFRDTYVYPDGSGGKSRYWQCENYIGCLLPEDRSIGLTNLQYCDCNAPVHDCIPLAEFWEPPQAVAECEKNEHEWEYEERFSGDYEGPSFMAPYGDRRWCKKCGRPEVKEIGTKAKTEQITGVGLVRLVEYAFPRLSRALSGWFLDERMVQRCRECGGHWYQIWGGSSRYICPCCGAWHSSVASGYLAGTAPPKTWTIVGRPHA